MGHCLRGGMMAVAAEKAAEPFLRESVEAAEALAGNANERERGHIAALRLWLDGDFKGATDRWGAVVEDHPRDLLAVQLAHLGDFYLGRSHMLRDRMTAALKSWDADVPGYGYVLGMHAFGLEEMDEFAAGEETGRAAVAHEPRDPWAIHAVAHVLEMQGRTEDGIAWFGETEPHWAPDNMFAFHNWWHRALYHLDRDKAADTLLATMERAAGETGTNAMMTRDVGLPLARVIAAFGREDYAAATDLIESVAPGANAFGGSNAQRDVVWRTLVEAAIRAGRGELARELTARRLDAKPESVFNRRNRTRAEAI